MLTLSKQVKELLNNVAIQKLTHCKGKIFALLYAKEGYYLPSTNCISI